MNTITPFHFFTAIFHRIRRPGRIMVWSQVRRSGSVYTDWCHTPHQAAGRVERYRLSREVFFGVAARHRGRALAEARRHDPGVAPSRLLGGAESAILLPALWAEIVPDAETPDRPDLRTLFEALPGPPSILLRLGRDLHAYWPLADPLELDGDDERRRGSLLLAKLRWALASSPAAAGWRIDRGGDLGGLMRVAGTFRQHRGRRLPLVVERFPGIHGPEGRWDAAGFDALPEPPPPSPRSPAAGAIVPAPPGGRTPLPAAEEPAGAPPGDRCDGAPAELVDGLEEVLAVLGGRATARRLVTVLSVAPPQRFTVLRSALRQLVAGLDGGVPTALQLGCLLRTYRGRAAGGRAIVRAGGGNRRSTWAVRRLPAAGRGPATGRPARQPEGREP